MKRSLSIILAAAAVLACTKTEQTFDASQQSEIAIMPVSGKMTKAAITDGVFPTDNHIGLYAFYTSDVNAGPVSDYSKFSIMYFDNTEFHCEAGQTAWDGLLSDYYWPATGSLVFAGYSLNVPKQDQIKSEQNGTPSYDLSKDQLKITGYTQSNKTDETYDLLYFGRTASSYGKNTLSVPVVFEHALAWIEVQVMGGTGALMGGGRTWRATKVEFRDVATKGNFEYKGVQTAAANTNPVKWTEQSVQTGAENVVVYTGSQDLTGGMKPIENVQAGTLIIPQAAKKLYVTIEYASPAGDSIKEVIEVDIPVYTSAWEAGKKYTYQLTFSPQEILVAPKVDKWPGAEETTWPSQN
jgi:hypothetical protein